MSATLAHATPAESPLEALVFRLGDERFALVLTVVDEVAECARPHVVPSSTAPMLGVVSLGGALLPAYSSHELLGVARAEGVDLPAIAILLRRGDHRIALLVDELLDVVAFPPSTLRPVSLEGAEARHVTGVISRGGNIVALLDAESLVGACLDRPLPETS